METRSKVIPSESTEMYYALDHDKGIQDMINGTLRTFSSITQ